MEKAHKPLRIKAPITPFTSSLKKVIFLSTCIIITGVNTSPSQDSPQYFSAHEIFDIKNNLDLIKNKIIPSIGTPDQIYVLAIFLGLDGEDECFFCIKKILKENTPPGNSNPSDYDYQIISKAIGSKIFTHGISQKSIDIPQNLPDFLRGAQRESQIPNKTTNDQPRTCYLFMNTGVDNGIMGGEIISPKSGTRSWEIFNQFNKLINQWAKE